MSSKIHGVSGLDIARLGDPDSVGAADGFLVNATDATQALLAGLSRAKLADAALHTGALEPDAALDAASAAPAHALDPVDRPSLAAFSEADTGHSALPPSSDSAASGLHSDAQTGGGSISDDGALWFGADTTSEMQQVEQSSLFVVNPDGTGLKTIDTAAVDSQSASSGYGGVSVDPADGLWFAQGESSNGPDIVAGHTTGGNGSPDTGTQTQIFNPVPNYSPGEYNINGMTIDTADHYLYYAYVGNSDDTTGIARIGYDPTTGAMGNETLFFTSTTTGLQAPNQVEYNPSDHLIYYVDSNNSSNYQAFDRATNGIYTVNPANQGGAPTELTSDSQFVNTGGYADSYANGNIVDVAVNAAQGLVYFVTQNTAVIADGNNVEAGSDEGSSEDAIWYVHTGGANQTAVELTLPSGVTLESAVAEGATFDAAGRVLYVSEQTVYSSTDFTDNILQLALNAAGTGFASGSATNLNQSEGSGGLTFVDGPVPTLNTASASYTSEASAINLFPSLTLTDPNSAPITSATVTLTGGYSGDGDVLSFSGSTGGLTVATSGAGSTETVTLSGTASAATYQAVLQELQFHTTTADPTNGGANSTRTVSVQASDLGQASDSSASSETLTLTALAKPTLSGFVSQTSDALQGGPPELALSPQETPGVTSSAPITSASIRITNTKAGDELTLIGLSNGTVDGGAITVGGVGTSTLTLTGTASAAEYSSLFSSVTYQDTGSDNGSNGHPSRTISWDVDNAAGAAVQPASTTVTIDRAPTVANVSLTVAAGMTGSTDAAHGLLSTASDADGDALSITALDGQAGYVGQQQDGSNGDVTVNADGSYSFAASASPSGATGSPVIEVASFTVSDGHGGFTTADLTVTIDRAPVGVGQTPTVSDGVQYSGNALTGASDPDTGATTFSVTSATPGGGSATAVAANGTTTISGTYGDLAIGANGSYTYTDGATAGEQSALASVSGSHPVDSFSVTLADTDGPATGTETLSFTIDRAPVVTAGATASYTDGAAAVTTDAGLTLSDPDGDNIASASVSIAAGFTSGDVLSETDANGIAGSYDAATGVLVLTGVASGADYQSVLDGVAFSATSETVAAHEGAGGADETRTLDYTASDGTLSAVVATSTVDVAIVIADSAANISAAIDSLNGDASISGIQITDGQPLMITAAQYAADTTALALITGAHEVDVSGVTGQDYTGVDVVFDSDGDLTSKTYTGVTGQAFASETVDFDSAGQKAMESFYDAQDDLLQQLTFSYAMNGSYSVTGGEFSPARAYASYVKDYDASGDLTGATFSGYTGEPYTTVAETYDSSGDLTSATYSGYTTAPYTSQVKAYDAGVLTSETFSGFTGAYATEVEDFNSSGQLTGETFETAQGAVIAEYSYSYGANGAYTLTEDDFSPAKAYASIEKDYGAGGVLSDIVYSGYTSEPYTTQTKDYAASGALTSITYSGFSGAYASLTETFDTSGRPATETYYNSAQAVVEKLTYTYSGANLASIQGSEITGQPYTGFLKDYAASGELISEAIYKTDGSEHDTAYASGVTFATDGATQTLSLVNGDIVSIGTGFGQVSINGYNGPDGGNETFDVSTAVFTDFDALLAHAHASGANTVVDGGSGGQLEFVNVTLAQLSQHGSDFHFM